jgi:hypothetical protein
MKRLILLFIVSLCLLALNLTVEVMAQKIPENGESIPTMPRLEVQKPSSLPATGTDAQVRRPSPATETATPRTGPTPFSSLLFADFDPNNGSLAFSHTLCFSPDANKKNPTENLISYIPIGKEILSWAPPGLKIDSGLTYFLPIARHCSAFASLKPSLTYLFTAPQTMMLAGFHIPIATGRPGGNDVSLKFSTAVDQQFRPVISFTFNLTPFKR